MHSQLSTLTIDVSAKCVLMRACTSARIGLVRYIVRNYPELDLSAALEAAVQHNHMQIASWLVDHGAEIGTYQHHYLLTNILYGSLDLFYIRLSPSKGYEYKTYNPYSQAIVLGNLDMVQFLRMKGGKCELALEIAAQYGHLDVVRYLYHILPESEIRNQQALQLAAQAGHLEVVRFFVAKAISIQKIHTSDSVVTAYLDEKRWLCNDISELCRLAAIRYALHYKTLPDPDTVPSVVTQILQAAMA